MKKGSANMWWIIIGAVIALVVMIILMMMFTGKTNVLEGGLLECEGKGGSCQYPTGTECTIQGGTYSKAFTCDNGNVCCFVSQKSAGSKCSKDKDCSSGSCSSGICT